MCTINVIEKDIKKEDLDAALIDLRKRIEPLVEQNVNIRCKLNEETKKQIEMKRRLRSRRPFTQTKTGEVIFPGKKEMESKLDIMENEVLKLMKVMDSFKRDRCQTELTRNIIESINRCKSKTSTENVIKELDEKYDKMKEEFNENMLEVSKYRVKMDELKKEIEVNEKRLKETKVEFSEASTKLNQLELAIKDASDNKDGPNLKKELDEVENRLDGLKSVIEYQMDELNAKNKQYMDAIHEKEYQSIRAKNLCEEKTRLTVEFETEFSRLKEYFKKRLAHVEHLPTALQAVNKQLSVQNALKTSVENSIEILSNKLKTITKDPDTHFTKNSRNLAKLKGQNLSLNNEREKMEKVLANIEHCYDVTKRKINEQNEKLKSINTETTLKMEEIRTIFKRPTEEYLLTIDELQNQVAKIEAYSCYEDGKLNLVSSAMQEQINALAIILRDAQEQTTEIESLQKYIGST